MTTESARVKEDLQTLEDRRKTILAELAHRESVVEKREKDASAKLTESQNAAERGATRVASLVDAADRARARRQEEEDACARAVQASARSASAHARTTRRLRWAITMARREVTPRTTERSTRDSDACDRRDEA